MTAILEEKHKKISYKIVKYGTKLKILLEMILMLNQFTKLNH